MITPLPIGFNDQLFDLEIKLEDEESLEIIQILTQMYRIAVDYYIEADMIRASYFQRKLKGIIIKSLNANTIEKLHEKKYSIPNKIKQEIHNYEQNSKTYIKTMIENKEKKEKFIQFQLDSDLNKQEQKLQTRMLKRIKSTNNL